MKFEENCTPEGIGQAPLSVDTWANLVVCSNVSWFNSIQCGTAELTSTFEKKPSIFLTQTLACPARDLNVRLNLKGSEIHELEGTNFNFISLLK